MGRVVPLLIMLLMTACGLAEDPRDEDNKLIYITFSDPAFEKYCLEAFDLNHDGRISRYEAQRVLAMRCPNLGIESMSEISAFSRIRTLDCSDNSLATLELSGCRELRTVDCSGNLLVSLDTDELRGLTQLNCSDNKLESLNLGSNVSLSTLDCRANDFTTLDVSNCSRNMESVDARECPRLTTFYIGKGQRVNYQVGSAQVIER